MYIYIIHHTLLARVYLFIIIYFILLASRGVIRLLLLFIYFISTLLLFQTKITVLNHDNDPPPLPQSPLIWKQDA